METYKALNNEVTFNYYSIEQLLLQFFEGRENVFANLYITSTNKTGIVAFCENRFQNICDFKKYPKCKNCPFKKQRTISTYDLNKHLNHNFVCAVYPITLKDTTSFVSVDFKKEHSSYLKKFISILNNFKITYLITNNLELNYEVIILFKDPIKAGFARRLLDECLTTLLKETYFDDVAIFNRINPNSNYAPKDNYGIPFIIPLSKKLLNLNISNLFDNDLNIINNPLVYLTTFKRNEVLYIELFLKQHKKITNPLNNNLIKVDNDSSIIQILINNNLEINTNLLTPKMKLKLKLLATIYSKQFAERQKRKISVYQTPRYIELFYENDTTLFLPRGLLDEIIQLSNEKNIKLNITDNTVQGEKVNIEFTSILYENQKKALKELLNFDNGLLVAPPAFGKTVLAIALICELKISTAILTDKSALIDQWKTRLKEHTKDGIIGEYHGRKKNLSHCIDIISFQSITKNIELLDNYGLVIIDEAHHIAAKSLSNVIRNIKAKYIYGLTATPKRSDKNEDIVYHLIGRIRYEEANTEEHNFNKILKLKKTLFVCDKNLDYTSQMNLLFINEKRNNLILNNVKEAFANNRKLLILTDRLEHIEYLYHKLKVLTPNLLVASGKLSKKERESFSKKLKNFESNSFIIIATGKLIGEGFDESRLDTLFITMPFKWSGTLEQYVGRIHRKSLEKKEVIVYDYLDYKMGVLLNMFKKRLTSYRKLGYIIEDESEQ